jgi:hypothetical protein
MRYADPARQNGTNGPTKGVPPVDQESSLERWLFDQQASTIYRRADPRFHLDLRPTIVLPRFRHRPAERSGGRPINRATRFLTLIGLLSFLLLLVAGCEIGSASSSDEPDVDALSTAESATGSGVPSTLESSLALVRPSADSNAVLGTAVIVRSDGLLVTSIDVGTGNIEVVLPDGEVYRPVLVATEPSAGIALLKVPADRAVPIQYSAERTSEGAVVYAAGYDDSSASVGRIGGTTVRVNHETEIVDYRVRGPHFIETDITLLSSFVGGVLTDDDDRFVGVLLPWEDDDGRQTLRAVSNWFVLGWLESLEVRAEQLRSEAETWSAIDLPGGWTVAQPEGWNLSVDTESEDRFRAELSPPDADATLRVSISVEPNAHGTDPTQFLDDVFADRSSARLWGIDRANGRPLVRLTMSQEGALVDVAYLLDADYLIAVSLTSAFRPEEDPAQSDRARALYDAVLGTLAR